MDFRKRLTAAAVVFASASAMAAYQYNWKGNQGWLTFDSTTEVSLAVGRSGKKSDGKINWIDRGEGVKDYGWYNMDTGEHGSFANNATATFTESDRIGLYVQVNSGETYYTTTKPGKDAPDNVVWGKSTGDDQGIRLYGGNKGSNGTHEYYVFKVSAAGASSTKAPSGQPLPGIIATLLVGGGTALFLKKRKKLIEEK